MCEVVEVWSRMVRNWARRWWVYGIEYRREKIGEVENMDMVIRDVLAGNWTNEQIIYNGKDVADDKDSNS